VTEQQKGAPEGAPVIYEQDCTSALDFLNALRPGLTVWDEGKCIFRGQGHDWPLVPSSHRSDRWADYQPWFSQLRIFRPQGSEENYVMDHRAEESLLRRFHDSIENSGLPVPQHHNPFEAMDGVFMGDGLYTAALYPLLALAQHHGIPTRLLDWSRRPAVAAYFAARQALDAAQEGAMVVWALRTDFFDRRFSRSSAWDAPYLEIVTAPRASNPNLHAQAGIFTLLNRRDQVQPLDAFVQECAQNAVIPNEHRPVMYRITAPKTEARRVLTRLSHEGVTASALFPGYDGVARDLQERAMLGRT
jgi:hypothetical protein